MYHVADVVLRPTQKAKALAKAANSQVPQTASSSTEDLVHFVGRRIISSNEGSVGSSKSGTTDQSFSTSPKNFFDNFSGFNQRPHAPIREEYNRLAMQMGWMGLTYRENRTECLGRELQYWAEKRSPNLSVLQQICVDLKIEDVPSSNSKCKKAFGKRFVNLFNYIDCKRKGSEVTPIFDNAKDFRNYMRKKQKFPLEAGKMAKGMREMLEMIFGNSLHGKAIKQLETSLHGQRILRS